MATVCETMKSFGVSAGIETYRLYSSERLPSLGRDTMALMKARSNRSKRMVMICQGENGMSRTLKECFPNIIQVLNIAAATEMVSDDIAETECWRAL
jgi:hypothetical protein